LLALAIAQLTTIHIAKDDYMRAWRVFVPIFDTDDAPDTLGVPSGKNSGSVLKLVSDGLWNRA